MFFPAQNGLQRKVADHFLLHVALNEREMEYVNHVIYDELCKGVISANSKQAFLAIIDGLVQRGAQGIILGCTEIGLLVQQKDSAILLFDTALIHAERAVLEALR